MALAAVLLATAALAGGCSWPWSDDGPPPTLPPPAEVDIPYGPVPGCEGSDVTCGGSQLLDIYRSPEAGPNPVLVWVHGGGFVAGDKEGVEESLQPVLDAEWDIVSINYRLTGGDGSNGFPAGLHDVNRAVRWVKANAAEQDWDPDSVAAMGRSAGGNLVGMVAATADDPSLQPDDLPAELAEVDPSVVAVIAVVPVADLATFAADGDWDQVVRDYTGCRAQDCTTAFDAASTPTHVDEAMPPMLAAHGEDDPIAPPSVGELVGQAYDDAGIGDRYELIVVDDGPEDERGHNLPLERIVDDVVELLNGVRGGQG